MNPKPQMLEGYVVEDDGKRWVMKLRENLWFHDGERVLARDCTASLRRWMKRDPGGATLEARLDALEAPDDRTIVLRLNKKFPRVAEAAVEIPNGGGDGAGADRQRHRSVQADDRDRRLRPVPLPEGRICDRQPRRAGAVRALYAARRTGEFYLGRASRAGGSGGVEDDPRSRHGGECAGDRRDRLAGDADAGPAGDAAAGTERGDRAARSVGLHQPVAPQPCRRADQQCEAAARDHGGDRSARGDGSDHGWRSGRHDRADGLSRDRQAATWTWRGSRR